MENWSFDSVSAFIGCITALLFFEIPSFFHLIYRKRAGYDCSKCKAWDCDGKHCSKMRDKKAEQGS